MKMIVLTIIVMLFLFSCTVAYMWGLFKIEDQPEDLFRDGGEIFLAIFLFAFILISFLTHEFLAHEVVHFMDYLKNSVFSFLSGGKNTSPSDFQKFDAVFTNTLLGVSFVAYWAVHIYVYAKGKQAKEKREQTINQTTLKISEHNKK